MAARRLPRIYIVGPFRATTEYMRRANIARAEAAALGVQSAGAFFRCPHTHTAHFDGLGSDSYWLALALDMLSECDAALLARDSPQADGGLTRHPWDRAYLDKDHHCKSSGSIDEVEWCRQHKIPVFATIGQLTDFIQQWNEMGDEPK